MKIIFESARSLDEALFRNKEEKERVSRIKKLGYDAYLVKPWAPDELLRIIKKVLQN